MLCANNLNVIEQVTKERKSFLTNTENIKELPADVPTPFFTENVDEATEADQTELRTHLQTIFSDVLPGFYEFQQAGYNLLYPKKVDIEALQERIKTMQIPTLIQPQQKLLEQAANAFLDRFRLFRKENEWPNDALELFKFRMEVKKTGWDESQTRNYHKALKHANRLSGYLSGALDLINILHENIGCQTLWETTRQANYNALLNELLPVNADVHNNQYTAQTRGNLTGKHPDNIKFNAIVNSVTLNERISRQTLSAEIEGLLGRLLNGIKLTRNYAKKIDETGEIQRVKRDILALSQVLLDVISVIQGAGKLPQPAAHRLSLQNEARTVIETASHQLGKTWNTVRQKVQRAKASGQALSGKTKKFTYRIEHALSCSGTAGENGDTHNINKAVCEVGIRLLDKIQQTTSIIHKTIRASRPLQQAVTHYSELDLMLSGTHRNSNGILDAKLRAELDRWQERAGYLKKKLQQLLVEITTLSNENMKRTYLSVLREELIAVTTTGGDNNIIRDFDARVKITIEGLSSIEKDLGQKLLRLSGHGQTGGKELYQHTVDWLQQLKVIKNELKTGIMQATGRSINNFSRQGMLARWMGEWSETEKQNYLGMLTAEDRAVIEKHYDTVFFEVIRPYLSLLSKKNDPQGERLLQRLRLEVNNAAKGTTLYPATMADILAGMKSQEQSIRTWSERKLIRTAFLAASLEGIKVLPNLLALPVRGVIKFGITSAKVAWVTRKGRQGIRGGEADINDEIAEYAKQSYKMAAIKVVLYLPPGLAMTIGVASIVWDVYEGGLKDAGKNVAKHIIGETPWNVLNAGSRTAAEAYATTLIEAAVSEGEISPVSHSLELQQQMNVKPFSDEHEPDAGQPRVRHKRRAPRLPGPKVIEGKKNEQERLSGKWHHNIPADATLHSSHFDFNRDIRFQDFSDKQKKQTYLHGMQFVLFQIQNDRHFPDRIRDNAYGARIGKKILVPVDIKGHRLNNAIFLPDIPGAKSGVMIRLDSKVPYYYVNKGEDLPANLKWAMPYNADKQTSRIFYSRYECPGFIINPGGIDTLNSIKAGKVSFEENFNYNNPVSMSINRLSEELAVTMEADYRLKGETITNKLLISRAIIGAHIPDPGVRATEVINHLEVSWDYLTPADYLRSFSRHFSILSGEMQLVISSINGETIQETELHVHQAEYIGSWVEATVGTITSFTLAGWVINTAQSAADIAADLADDNKPDPLAVAGLIVGCIPGEKIAAKVGKFTQIGGKAVKYGIMLGNKSIDLAIIGISIETAIKTGEPLAIYQAFLASGMSVKNSYDLARNMSSQLKISRRMEDSASLEELEAIHTPQNKYSSNSIMPERTFRFGQIMLLGRIDNGEIYISRDYGLTWKRGSQLHLLAYRLQNAGGRYKNKPIEKVQNMSLDHAREIRSLIWDAKDKAIVTLERAIKKMKSSNRNDIIRVNLILDMFLGKSVSEDKNELLRNKVIKQLENQMHFLNDFKVSKDMIFQGGVKGGHPNRIFETQYFYPDNVTNSSAQITVFSGGLVNANDRLGYSKDKFENFISTALIHESYHVFNKNSPDLCYPGVYNDSLDVSEILKVSAPLLRGQNIKDTIGNEELMSKAFNDGWGKDKFAEIMNEANSAKRNQRLKNLVNEKLSLADMNVWKNPDNTSYMLTLISYLDVDNSRFNEFLSRYENWRKDISKPLSWNFSANSSHDKVVFEYADENSHTPTASQPWAM